MKITDDRTNIDYYLEWSTIVDAPVTYGLILDEFKKYYKQEYGEQGMKELPERLKRVEENNIGAYPPFDNYSSYFEHNRAGENETTLNKEGILKKYCRLLTPNQKQ